MTKSTDTHLLQSYVKIGIGSHGSFFRDVFRRRITCNVQQRDKARIIIVWRNTHLKNTSLPCVDCGLALKSENINFSFYQFKSENFGATLCELKTQQDDSRKLPERTMKIGGQTFIASDVPGSSSNLYSVSGSKTHSLDSTAFFSDIARFSDSWVSCDCRNNQTPSLTPTIPMFQIRQVFLYLYLSLANAITGMMSSFYV